MQVGTWLRSLGCERFEKRFEEHEITVDVLPLLTEGDLRELDIPLGPRRVLLNAIAQLGKASVEPGASRASRDSEWGDVSRRQISVLFCDIVGSTEMSVKLDPEDMHEVLEAFRACATTEIELRGGFIAQYLGDGALAYFGYPEAGEDDAERAVRAGLAIVRRARRLETHEPLHARCGIATGVVVVGDLIGQGKAQQRGVVGETPNLAARLESMAEPSSVVISTATHKLTGGLFRYGEIREQQLKGFRELVGSYEVLGESGVVSRFEALRTRHVPLIGRDEELAVMQDCWAKARANDAQVLTISGEPGIGKSRLLASFGEIIGKDHHALFKYFCSPEYSVSPLYPILTQLKQAASIQDTDTTEHIASKLQSVLAQNDGQMHRADTLARLLSANRQEHMPTTRKQKDRAFEALLGQLTDRAQKAPVVLWFEDVHWIDPSSLELLRMLANAIGGLPMLVLITFRPEFEKVWREERKADLPLAIAARETSLTLRRLDSQSNLALVEAVASGAQLPAETLARIAGRTDGVPLFIEEVTRGVVEASQVAAVSSAQHAASADVLPATLQDSLTARLDRLGAAGETAKAAAVIGREFTVALLSKIVDNKPATLRKNLARLVQSKIVLAETVNGASIYRFKHALIQDAAYASLLRGQRARLHGLVADALEQGQDSMPEMAPEILARHWARAGNATRAVGRFVDAAARALSQSASREAGSLLDEASALLGQIEDSQINKLCEAEIQLLHSHRLVISDSYTAPGIRAALERAELLGKEIENDRIRTEVLTQRWSYLLFTGEPQKAHRDARMLFDSVSRANEPPDKAAALNGCIAMGMVDQAVGSLTSALDHFRQARLLSDLIGDTPFAILGMKPAFIVRSWQAWALFQLGYPEQALAMSQQSIRFMEGQDDPLNLCAAIAMDSVLQFACRDVKALEQCGLRMEALGKRYGLSFYISVAPMSIGGARVLGYADAAGLDQVATGLQAVVELGFVYQHAIVSCTYLESLLALGQSATGLEQVDAALALVQGTGEREFYPELLRLKGEFLMQQNRRDDAEEWFHAALHEAREQQAKMWELRASLGLAGIYCANGDLTAAQALIRPVYEWFSEGAFMREMREARAILEA